MTAHRRDRVRYYIIILLCTEFIKLNGAARQTRRRDVISAMKISMTQSNAEHKNVWESKVVYVNTVARVGQSVIRTRPGAPAAYDCRDCSEDTRVRSRVII